MQDRTEKLFLDGCDTGVCTQSHARCDKTCSQATKFCIN